MNYVGSPSSLLHTCLYKHTVYALPSTLGTTSGNFPESFYRTTGRTS